MTARQLKTVEGDYAVFVGGDKVLAVEEVIPGALTACDICGRKLGGWYASAKQIVFEPTGAGFVRHYRLVVCRQGVACRKRRASQLA